ncbi:glycosyltransferase [Roseateles sp.]|uniref:glycosyltransferase family 4 protein n=1 Tax=Roseateles sp. TaxID=1971397 RepID=UPI002F4181D3
MHLLFLYVGLPLGGIETLLVRLSTAMQRSGARVSVLLATRRADPGLLAELRQHASVAFLDEFLPPGPWRPIHAKPLTRFVLPLNVAALREWLGGAPDVCHAPDTTSLMFASRLATAVDLGRVTAGVYHDREYLFEDTGNRYVDWGHSLFRALPAENVVFFNETSVRVHEQRFGRDFSASPVSPIGVDLDRWHGRTLGRRSDRVISIGRLTPFKTYNTHMIDTIARLKATGLPLRYEIYGTGECEEALRQQIVRLGVEDLISLKGAIAYEHIQDVLAGALAFVGSGTALIEASAAGVPAIVGIEHVEDATTYGFLHQLTGLSYHDQGLPFTTTTFDDCLRSLYEGSDAAYEDVARRAVHRAEDFSLARTTRAFLKLMSPAGARAFQFPKLGIPGWVCLNASMVTLIWRSRRGHAKFFARHSNVDVR